MSIKPIALTDEKFKNFETNGDAAVAYLNEVDNRLKLLNNSEPPSKEDLEVLQKDVYTYSASILKIRNRMAWYEEEKAAAIKEQSSALILSVLEAENKIKELLGQQKPPQKEIEKSQNTIPDLDLVSLSGGAHHIKAPKEQVTRTLFGKKQKDTSDPFAEMFKTGPIKPVEILPKLLQNLDQEILSRQKDNPKFKELVKACNEVEEPYDFNNLYLLNPEEAANKDILEKAKQKLTDKKNSLEIIPMLCANLGFTQNSKFDKDYKNEEAGLNKVSKKLNGDEIELNKRHGTKKQQQTEAVKPKNEDAFESLKTKARSYAEAKESSKSRLNKAFSKNEIKRVEEAAKKFKDDTNKFEQWINKQYASEKAKASNSQITQSQPAPRVRPLVGSQTTTMNKLGINNREQLLQEQKAIKQETIKPVLSNVGSTKTSAQDDLLDFTPANPEAKSVQNQPNVKKEDDQAQKPAYNPMDW